MLGLAIPKILQMEVPKDESTWLDVEPEPTATWTKSRAESENWDLALLDRDLPELLAML